MTCNINYQLKKYLVRHSNYLCVLERPCLTCTLPGDHLTVLSPLPDPPEVKVAAGPSLDLNNIKEGDDVYFDCHVKARPETLKIKWMFNVSIYVVVVVVVVVVMVVVMEGSVSQCVGE